jgi:hypothetical protein
MTVSSEAAKEDEDIDKRTSIVVRTRLVRFMVNIVAERLLEMAMERTTMPA